MLSMSEKQRAEYLHRQGEVALARKSYEAHLIHHPNDADALHAFGVLLAQCRQYEQAKEKIQLALAINTNQFTYHNSLGNVFSELSQYHFAENAYKKAIKLNCHYAIAHNNLGNIYLRQKKLVAAKASYEKAIQLKPDYADAHCNLGILLTELGDNNQAIDSLNQALCINSACIKAKAQLADHYLRQQKYHDAQNLLLACVEKCPDVHDYLYRLGIVYFNLHDFESANDLFEKVLMRNDKHADINQYLANTLLELREHEKAMYYYYRQLEINPLFQTYYNLGVLLMMKERLNDALSYFENALQMTPIDIATHLNCGHIYLKRNQIEDAVRHYQTANSLKPNDVEIQHILSALTQSPIPEKAPSAYITHLFDQYADYYDKHLTEYLKYEVPQKIIATLLREYPLLPEKGLSIVDLGCGTGLCGEFIKPHAKELIGIDLSPKMLSIARRKNIYDQLLEEDITTSLTHFSSLDLIIAADVFTYFGDLNPSFARINHALKDDGLFIFTVEKTHQNNFILQSTIRYAHHRDYLVSCATNHHFEIVTVDNIVLRQQQKKPIEGYMVLLKSHLPHYAFSR